MRTSAPAIITGTTGPASITTTATGTTTRTVIIITIRSAAPLSPSRILPILTPGHVPGALLAFSLPICHIETSQIDVASRGIFRVYYQDMMNDGQQIDLVQRALADTRPVPADELLIPHDGTGEPMRQMAPGPDTTPREAAALLLFYPYAGELWFPLTVRTNHLPQHRGEVSLPGGATDPEDAGATGTALRESHEELGIAYASVEVWGTLASIYIPPSNFRLTPVVGFSAAPPHYRPNPDEIAAVFCVPLRQVLDPATVVVEVWTLRGERVHVPFFALEGYKVWGATALVLSELVARLRRLLAEAPANT
jgi:8-oxo-dGTP pyrophosphatase MutT (NUDIX family)